MLSKQTYQTCHSTEPCQHIWIPVEYEAGCRRYHNDMMSMDWSVNIINAHRLRVTKLFCPQCTRFLVVPSSALDK